MISHERHDNQVMLARVHALFGCQPMSESPESPIDESLVRRRVSYDIDICTWGEGIVTQHNIRSGMVTVMAIDDGSFWRGHEEHVEVIV